MVSICFYQTFIFPFHDIPILIIFLIFLGYCNIIYISQWEDSHGFLELRNRLQLRDLNEGLQMAAIAADDTEEVLEVLVPEMLERYVAFDVYPTSGNFDE